MKKIYHLALHADWADVVEQGGTYYPPTYDQDGFTHGTSDTDKLLEVANHFYAGSCGDWVCLEMTVASLGSSGVEVRFEPAAAVGEQDGQLDSRGQASPILFPHLYGGISPAVVINVHPVERDAAGTFTSIVFSRPD